MNKLQKMGGIAALYEAAAYLIGMIGFLLVVDVSGAATTVEKLALIIENQTFLSVLHLIVYVIWAIFLVILALALHNRLKADSSALAQMAAVFAFIWAGLVIASGTIYNVGMETAVTLHATNPEQAAAVWITIESVVDGLSGVELVGGMWMLLNSWAALRSGAFPKALNYLGLLIGVAGISTVLPGLGSASMIFGLGQIVWFIWLGLVMLRQDAPATDVHQDKFTPQHKGAL